MLTEMLVPVVMAGGSGTRLWPMSRKYLPKQFLRLGSQNTMLQDTLLRLTGLKTAKPIIITGNEHRFLVAEQLREINIEADILLEPEGKNTAPAIALAANWSLKRSSAEPATSNPLLLVLASDHIIQNVRAFHTAVLRAAQIASTGKLVTFGVVPTEPHTGYGYIRYDSSPTDKDVPSHTLADSGGFKVRSFTEKPDLKTATEYVKSDRYLWNSGMFLFRAQDYLNELNKYAPAIAESCEKAVQAFETDLDFIRIDEASFSKSDANSIDYAVMEKTDKATVIPLDAGWSDVGSWTSLWDLAEKDQNENHVSNCQSINEETRGCMIVGDESRLIGTLGVEDLVIVDTKDALLVAHKKALSGIKNVVEKLKEVDGDYDEFHRVVYRPWGHYDSIDEGERFKVKRITVKPGEKLSTQMHHHRSEHWIIVRGTARVTRQDEAFTVAENESVFLPRGCIHSLENPGKIPLELIEVQTGSYLGEDDIVRFDDRYGR
ncbi:MAG: mannose-1-phosphate guanylyltransferase/mannose-6-phosphate isomerase [bacterium]